jgi:phosphatidylserine/phosphatidylglycerophosphate/cardiolipin synthase-like enzyme
VSTLSRSIGRVDAHLGDGIERAVRAHHRRRLQRVGWDVALDAPASFVTHHTFPTRGGNAIEVLVDGAQALPQIAEAIRTARVSVHLAGWYFSPEFELTRAGDQGTLADLLRETAARGVDVRLLAWAGAPVPVFRPGRRQVRQAMAALSLGSRIRVATDRHERPMHCHHEKIVIIDGERAFVGGIDLTSLSGDRFDSEHHPLRSAAGWHDATMLAAGPVVADVAAHFAMRWHEVTGERLEPSRPPQAVGNLTAQVARTIPEGIYDAMPRGDFSILEAYLGAIRNAQRLVYLENQFLWSSELAIALAALLRNPPSDEFRMVIVLPAHPNTGADDTRGQLGVLASADVDRRLLACTLIARGEAGQAPVYVHAKVAVIDDRWLTVGSANLNEHSMFNDTEVNLTVDDAALATATRRQLWAEHLELPLEAVAGDAATLVDDVWWPTATEQLERRRTGLPLTHRLVLLPGVSHRSRRLLGPIQSLLVDG